MAAVIAATVPAGTVMTIIAAAAAMPTGIIMIMSTAAAATITVTEM